MDNKTKLQIALAKIGEAAELLYELQSQLNDDESANILTFILNSWGNEGEVVTNDEVSGIRAMTERAEGAAD